MNDVPPYLIGYGGTFLCVLSISDQRALTDAGHGFNLLVALTAVQKLNCMLQLTLRVLLRSALPEVGILAGNGFSGLGALHNHAPLILRKGEHHRQNQIPGEGVLDESHVQDVHPYTSVKKLSDGRNPVNCGACEPIQLGDDQSITWLQLLKKGGKSRSFHALACEGFGDDLLTAIGLQRFGLVFQAVAVDALACGGNTGIAVNHVNSS